MLSSTGVSAPKGMTLLTVRNLPSTTDLFAQLNGLTSGMSSGRTARFQGPSNCSV